MIHKLMVAAAVLALTAALPGASAAEGQVIGMSAVSRQVANLDRSIAYYEAMGMKVSAPPAGWTADPLYQQLFRAPGAEWRTAWMTADSGLYMAPFTLVLREFRGIDRQDWSGLKTWSPGMSHIGYFSLTPRADWEALRAKGLLRPKSAGGDLYIQPNLEFGLMVDPDGMGVEVRSLPRQGGVARSAGTVTGRPGFSHSALVVRDIERTKRFYEVLGLTFPAGYDRWTAGEFSEKTWSLPKGTEVQVVYAYGPAATSAAPAPGAELRSAAAQMPIEFVAFKSLGLDEAGGAGSRFYDIAVHAVVYEVRGIEDVRRALLAAGGTAWTDGIVTLPRGDRATIVRDPDGGFLQLLQRP